MTYYATDLNKDKPLIYKINSGYVQWYSYHSGEWKQEIASVSLTILLDKMQEVTKEQVESFLYMRELVT